MNRSHNIRTPRKSGRIRVDLDPDVYEAIAQRARGFENPNEVLRRLLKLPPR
jgi:hypothetical protein